LRFYERPAQGARLVVFSVHAKEPDPHRRGERDDIAGFFCRLKAGRQTGRGAQSPQPHTPNNWDRNDSTAPEAATG